MARRKTQIEFVEEASKVHSNFYNYELVSYVNSTTNVKIICPVHGMFEQTPATHLNNRGCKECGKLRTISAHKKDTETFIQKAKLKHGELYDYSSVVYVGNKEKVDIRCNVHGIFKQTPNNHLTGYGCNRCGCNRTNSKNTGDSESFIKDAIRVHGNLYQYDKVHYVSSRRKVEIICKKHGSFFQKPIHHINNRSGCQKCRLSKAVIDICNLLEDNNIQFITEHRFDDCKSTNTLPYDFYIEKFNLCIEYDGKQHFHAVDFWGGNEGLKKQKKHDSIKTNYCNENGINLLRIRYDCNHNTVLKEFFKQQFNHDLKD